MSPRTQGLVESFEMEETMRLRCSDPACNKVICSGYVRVDGRTFCSHECANTYLVQANIFSVAADPYAERKHVTKNRNHYSYGPIGSQEDWGDVCEKQLPLPLEDG